MEIVIARNSLKAMESYAGKFLVGHPNPGTIKKLNR